MSYPLWTFIFWSSHVNCIDPSRIQWWWMSSHQSLNNLLKSRSCLWIIDFLIDEAEYCQIWIRNNEKNMATAMIVTTDYSIFLPKIHGSGRLPWLKMIERQQKLGGISMVSTEPYACGSKSNEPQKNKKLRSDPTNSLPELVGKSVAERIPFAGPLVFIDTFDTTLLRQVFCEICAYTSHPINWCKELFFFSINSIP